MRRFLKLATRRQIEALGGLEAAAHLTRVGKTELGNYESPAHPERFMPIDVAADLAVASGTSEIFDELATLVGCTCVPSPRRPKSLCADFRAFGDCVAAAFRDFPALLGNGKLDRRNIEQLDQDLALIIRAAMNAQAALRGLAENTPISALPCCETNDTAESPLDATP